MGAPCGPVSGSSFAPVPRGAPSAIWEGIPKVWGWEGGRGFLALLKSRILSVMVGRLERQTAIVQLEAGCHTGKHQQTEVLSPWALWLLGKRAIDLVFE